MYIKTQATNYWGHQYAVKSIHKNHDEKSVSIQKNTISNFEHQQCSISKVKLSKRKTGTLNKHVHFHSRHVTILRWVVLLSISSNNASIYALDSISALDKLANLSAIMVVCCSPSMVVRRLASVVSVKRFNDHEGADSSGPIV